ncbi:MAG: hypothetical protein ACT4PM_11090 [Gemmatimonadales bacterium]
MRLALGAALSGGVLWTACGSHGATTGQVSVRDSAGIEIVESTPPPASPPSPG